LVPLIWCEPHSIELIGGGLSGISTGEPSSASVLGHVLCDRCGAPVIALFYDAPLFLRGEKFTVFGRLIG